MPISFMLVPFDAASTIFALKAILCSIVLDRTQVSSVSLSASVT